MIPVVVGSSPIVHPILGPLAQLVEQVTLNHLVEGSSPSRPTISSSVIQITLFMIHKSTFNGGILFLEL